MIERAESSAIVKVAFDGDELEVVRDTDSAYVVIRRVCEVLALHPQTQVEKLRAAPWAVARMIRATGPDGKNYDALCLDIKCLGMWMATINPRKVGNAALRPKLVRWQIDAARVLNDLFFGREQRIVEPDHGLIILDRLEEIKALCMAQHPLHLGRVSDNPMMERQMRAALHTAADAAGISFFKMHGIFRVWHAGLGGYKGLPQCLVPGAIVQLRDYVHSTPVGALAKQLTLWPTGGAV